MDPISNGRKSFLPLNIQFFADPAGDGGDVGNGADPDANNPAGDDPKGGNGGDNGGDNGENGADVLQAQIEKLQQEMAKQKEALDKATKEAGDYRKQLKAKMTQEEIDAANKKEAEEKAAKELEDLRKKVAKAENTKNVMGKLSLDEDTAGQIAESLIGCENIENALLLLQKAWTAKEKALRIEFGKIPGPGQGGSNEEDAEEKAAIELAKNLGRERASMNKSVADGLQGYIR